MKFSLSLFLMMLSFSSYSGDRLSLYDCNHGQNNRIGELLNTHYQLQRDLNLPRITNFEQEQRLKASGSCAAFEELINREIRVMQSQAPANAPEPRSRIEPHPRPTNQYEEESRDDENSREDERRDPRPEPRREAPPQQRPEPRREAPPQQRPAPRREAPRAEAPRQQPREETVRGVALAEKGILIVTDERNLRAARIVKDSFKFMKPFSCLNIPVVIHQVSSSEFNCNPHTPRGQVNRIIVCDESAQRKADNWKKQAKASHVVIVAQSSLVGGNGGVPATVTSSIILGYGPHAGVHEFLHTLGFDDEYQEGRYSVESGDIMACTGPGCFVGEDKWEKVASKFSRRLPADCR